MAGFQNVDRERPPDDYDRSIIGVVIRNVLPSVLGSFGIAAGIFFLTEQSAEETSLLSDSVERALIVVVGWIPGLFDKTTGLWLGTDLRHWAHVIEFAALGAFVSTAFCNAKPRIQAAQLIQLSAPICAAYSLFDQCHKLLVPARHFNALGLGMDALGYLSAAIAVAGLRATQLPDNHSDDSHPQFADCPSPE